METDNSLSTQTMSKRKIGFLEPQLWTPKQYLRTKDKITVPPRELISNRTLDFSLVEKTSVAFQNAPESFAEFDGKAKEVGYTSDQMRVNGCGISALYVVLKTLSFKKEDIRLSTVGTLALDVVSMHRNDNVIAGDMRKIGTPVFNLQNGWYHNALIYEASKFGVKGERYEDADIIDMSFRMIELQRQNKNPLLVISVGTDMWLLPHKVGDQSTKHLVVINGFKYSDESLLEIKATDPYIAGDQPQVVNELVKSNKLAALNKKGIIFYT